MKIYLAAGEPSGDLLASGLMSALRRLYPDVEFRGVGGESMAAAGLHSIFDISDISVMGIFEVIPRLPVVMKRLEQTTADIVAWRPDVVVTVDSWGFMSQLIKRLRKTGVKFPVVNYVAPQVWAWKRGRARKVAQLVDRLMTLLPDEGRYFEKYGLRCDFVGHPVIERMSTVETDPDGFRLRHDIPPGARVVCVLPGSRMGEVKRLGPVLRDAVKIMQSKLNNIFVAVPAVGAVEGEIRKIFEGSDIPLCVIAGEKERYDAFAASSVALAKSGTVSLELAAIGVPHLICYKFNALTNLFARKLVKLKFVNLLNIICNKEIIPEFLLRDCRADMIAECGLGLLSDREKADSQVASAREVLNRLRLPDILPSDRAAQIVAEMATEALPGFSK